MFLNFMPQSSKLESKLENILKFLLNWVLKCVISQLIVDKLGFYCSSVINLLMFVIFGVKIEVKFG